jgi:hypothetical protein
MAYLRRRGSSERQPMDGGAFITDPAEMEKWGAVLEFLFAETYPDGGERKTGTLLLFVDEGRLKVCLSDRDQGLVGFVTGSTVMEVLMAAESSLRQDSVDWRASRDNGRKPRR